MKLHPIRRSAFAATLLAAAVSTSHANDLYLDANGNSPGVGATSPVPWNDTTKFWAIVPTGLASTSLWTSNDDAFLTGTPGIVTLNSNIVARSISITSDGYQLAGSNLTLSYTANGAVSQFAPATASSISIATGLTTTFNNTFVGSMDLNLVGAGTAILAHTNSFTGNVNVANGTLQVNDDNALGDANNTLALYSSSFSTNAATHSFQQNLSLFPLGNLSLYNFTGPGISFSGTTNLSFTSQVNVTANSSLTLAGALVGPGTLVKSGAGNLTLSGTAPNGDSGGITVSQGALLLNKSGAALAVTGPVIVDGSGTLTLLASEQIADSADVAVNANGTFDLNSKAETIASVGGNGTLTLGTGLLSLKPAIDTTFSGSLSGSGATILHNGAGALTLSGNKLGPIAALNNFGGPLLLSNGSLALTSTGQTGFGGLSSLFVEGNASVKIQQGFSLTTYATPSVHNNGSILVDGAQTLWINYDAPGAPADIRIGYAGGTSLLTVQNGAFVGSYSYLSIGSHRISNTGVGSVLVQSGATLSAIQGLRMDADCTLTVDHAYANFGGLTSIDTSTPSIFLADPTPTASAILMTAGNITSTFAGNIADAPSGSGGIHMIANDNLTLTGHNTYTGPTRIDAGILTQSGGSNNSSVTVSNSGQFVANNTTLSLLNGTGGVTVNTGALASYANSTINGGYLAGAGAHFIEGSTLNNTTIQFGATALISNPSVFNNVTLNGTLVTDETLLWSTGTLGSAGQFTIYHPVNASSLVSNGVITIGGVNIPVASSLSVSGFGLVLGAGSRTYVGSSAFPGASLSVPGSSFQLNGGLLENYGAVSGNLIVNFGSLAEGPGTYTNLTVTRGGQIVLSANQLLSSLSVNGGTLTITAGATKASAYSLGGTANAWSGQLELGGNILILQATPAAKLQLLSNLANQIAFGKSHNAGITDSAPLPAHTALAVIDNASLPTPFTSFAGQPVDLNSLLIAPALLGDTNFDGTVNIADLNTLLQHFGTTTPSWTSGNFDNASTIDLTDLSDVLNSFGLSISNPGSASAPAPTPEPLSLALLAPAATLLLNRRRK